MHKTGGSGPSKPPTPTDKAARLAEALRANLSRRKAQKRARGSPASAASTKPRG